MFSVSAQISCFHILVNLSGRTGVRLVVHSNSHRLPSSLLTFRSIAGHGIKEYPSHFLIPIDRWSDAATTTTLGDGLSWLSTSFPISYSIFSVSFSTLLLDVCAVQFFVLGSKKIFAVDVRVPTFILVLKSWFQSR